MESPSHDIAARVHQLSNLSVFFARTSQTKWGQFDWDVAVSVLMFVFPPNFFELFFEGGYTVYTVPLNAVSRLDKNHHPFRMPKTRLITVKQPASVSVFLNKSLSPFPPHFFWWNLKSELFFFNQKIPPGVPKGSETNLYISGSTPTQRPIML